METTKAEHLRILLNKRDDLIKQIEKLEKYKTSNKKLMICSYDNGYYSSEYVFEMFFRKEDIYGLIKSKMIELEEVEKSIQDF